MANPLFGPRGFEKIEKDFSKALFEAESMDYSPFQWQQIAEQGNRSLLLSQAKHGLYPGECREVDYMSNQKVIGIPKEGSMYFLEQKELVVPLMRSLSIVAQLNFPQRGPRTIVFGAVALDDLKSLHIKQGQLLVGRLRMYHSSPIILNGKNILSAAGLAPSMGRLLPNQEEGYNKDFYSSKLKTIVQSQVSALAKKAHL